MTRVATLRRRSKNTGEQTSAVRTTIVYLLVAATLFPLVWLLVNSFRNSTDIFRSLSPLSITTIIPEAVTFENYVKLAQSGFFQALGNSLLVASVSVVLGLVLGSLAAYALAVLHFPGRNVAFLVVIVGFMLPFEVVAIPLYQLFVDWSLINTYAGLIIPGIANGLAIFNLRQAFLGVPPSMREAAIIDGASEIRVFRSVYLPLNSSALINSAILIFLGQWAAYLWPLLVVSEPALQVAPVNHATAFTQYTFDFGYSFAGTVVLSVVPAVILLVFRRYFVMASLGSATKG
jgi:multiple sugar transport system permease protein/putative chitobiose transport system permease protein